MSKAAEEARLHQGNICALLLKSVNDIIQVETATPPFVIKADYIPSAEKFDRETKTGEEISLMADFVSNLISIMHYSVDYQGCHFGMEYDSSSDSCNITLYTPLKGLEKLKDLLGEGYENIQNRADIIYTAQQAAPSPKKLQPCPLRTLHFNA